MDIRKIKKLIELLEESGVAEIEIKEGEESVRIARQSAAGAQAQPAAAPLVTHTLPAAARPGAPAAGRPATSPSAPAEEAAGTPVARAGGHGGTGPTGGRLYNAPAPRAQT